MRVVNHGASRPTSRTIRGQGLTEYIVILALIAVAAVASVGFFGSAVKSQFVALAAEVIGEEGDAALTTPAAAVGDEITNANTAATLKTYTK